MVSELENNKNLIWDAREYDYEDEWSFWDEEYKIEDVSWNAQASNNQWTNTKSKSACTIFWAVGAIQHLFNLQMSVYDANQLWLDAVDYCVKYWGYTVGKWWWCDTACKYVADWWNNTQAEKRWLPKVFYLRRYWTDAIIAEALNKWHYIGFSKTANWYADKVKGLIDKDSYSTTTGHRLNFKSTSQTKATSWLENDNYDVWVHDNYEWNPWQQFFIKNRKTYIGKWINWYCYLFLPESNMVDTTIEEKKDEIEVGKAVNALIWTLSTTRGSLPKEFQDKVSALASDLRKAYPDARKLVNDESKKHYQVIVDQLSFNRKRADGNYKEAYWALAKEIREKFWVL